MSHNYFIELSEFLKKRCQALQSEMADTMRDSPNKRLMAGRMDAIQELQHFLDEKFSAKLPGRIYRSYQKCASTITSDKKQQK
jgi:hypothetical protein